MEAKREEEDKKGDKERGKEGGGEAKRDGGPSWYPHLCFPHTEGGNREAGGNEAGRDTRCSCSGSNASSASRLQLVWHFETNSS